MRAKSVIFCGNNVKKEKYKECSTPVPFAYFTTISGAVSNFYVLYRIAPSYKDGLMFSPQEVYTATVIVPLRKRGAS